MSEKAVTAPEPKRRPMHEGVWLFMLAGLPGGQLINAIREGGSARDMTLSITSWTLVAFVTLLAVVALNRIMVNLRWNRRPFTEKDQWYCQRAFYLAFFSAAFQVAILLIVTFASDGSASLDAVLDTMTMQNIYLLTLAVTLRVLACVHHRGRQYYEELEKGV